VSGERVSVRRGVVHASAACPCRKCIESGEAVHWAVSELHR